MSNKSYNKQYDVPKYSKRIDKGRKQQMERIFIKNISQLGVYDEDIDILYFQKNRTSKRVYN